MILWSKTALWWRELKKWWTTLKHVIAFSWKISLKYHCALLRRSILKFKLKTAIKNKHILGPWIRSKLHLLVILLFDPVPKIQKPCDFPQNNTFFAPYRVRRFSTGFGDCFCRVSETFPRGSWPLGLPSLARRYPWKKNVFKHFEEKNFEFF